MESSLLVQEFEEVPSPGEFSAQIESKNVPAVFRGCVKDWKASKCWKPSAGGLDYLEELVGPSVVEAMMSSCAPVFYGDIRRHERVEVPFSTFIGLCKQHLRCKDDPEVVFSESDEHKETKSDVEGCSSNIEGVPQQIYLAQVPIFIGDDEERVQLDGLRADISTPSFLESKKVASVNLWMNNNHSRSSTHYDPHHNLLCLVAGCKQVVLWPPSASPLLYLMPIYGEASNHSSVALDTPDHSVHPRSTLATVNSQKVILGEGDALFIPEGCHVYYLRGVPSIKVPSNYDYDASTVGFLLLPEVLEVFFRRLHQVDSDDLTIAVNFWWRSDIMSSMMDHMDSYYLRRSLRRLIDKEMNQMLQQNSASGLEDLSAQMSNVGTSGNCDGNEAPKHEVFHGLKKQSIGLEDLAPKAIWALHELIALVHDHVNVTDKNAESTPVAALPSYRGEGGVKQEVAKLYNLEDDPVAKILQSLDALTLQNVLLAMVHKFPRTLEALVLQLLSPVGSEVLTRKFDEMDKKMDEDDRSKFYQLFYSVFDDHFSAADVILQGKESFAHQAFKSVLDLHLGVHID